MVSAMSIHHEITLVGFVRSDSPQIEVRLTKIPAIGRYFVKVDQTTIVETFALSSALRELAETVGQLTNGFSSWSEIT